MALITTRFGFRSTALEVVEGIDLTGRRAIVTGAASGIGVETARALAKAGAEVTLAVRDVAAGGRVAADIAATTGNGRLRVERLDLALPASVRDFASRWSGPLHVLVNNAGVMAIPELTLTPEGWEMQFATNHLGHFALALALHGALARAGSARIVSVSSSAHQRSPVVFDDLHFRFRLYEPWAAYGQSKTANVLFALGASARWARDGVTANALMPGTIKTNLQRYVGSSVTVPEALRKSVEQGAATSVLLAVSPLLEGVGGRYFFDCNEAPLIESRSSDMSGVAPYALDPENAERLWEVSLRLLGVPAGRRAP